MRGLRASGFRGLGFRGLLGSGFGELGFMNQTLEGYLV